MIRSPLASDFILAPNVEPRRNGRAVDMLVLHYTDMKSASAACRKLCSPISGVSCHYLVDVDGSIVQMAGEEMRAWHAGYSFWRGESDTNSRSIGIEIQNPGHSHGYEDFGAAQMEAVAALCRDVLSRHAIPARNILGHSDVAPGRKIDPGEKFDWRRLSEAGVGHWVEPEPVGADEALGPGSSGEAVADLQRKLARYGYGVETSGEYGEVTFNTVAAFQRHFRQARVDGLADASTRLTLSRLLAS